MTVNTYPDFKPGQTLTANELDLLANHAWHRDRLVGRMVGFGINGGLGGAFSGNTLTIQPGLAVDQSGEPLVMRTAKTLTFSTAPGAPTTLSTTPYPFIGAQADTWSVVLQATDVEVTHDTCTEVGCLGHSGTHTRDVELRVVAGRVTGPRFDFAKHKVHQIQPLRLTALGQPVGNLADFKSDLTEVLTELNPGIDTTLIAKVNAVTIPNNELIGVKGYKVGWLNTVLFATIDLIRCRALQAIETFRNDAFPGVVLGAVTRTGSTWTFDCAYKHFWEPPKGLSQALLGGGCASVCQLSVNYLTSVLSNYAPPDPPPAPPPPPSGGGGAVLDPDIIYCILGKPNCGIVLWPGRKFREKVPPLPEVDIGPHPEWVYKGPDIRVIEEINELYGTVLPNELGDGVFIADSLIGHYAENVVATLEYNILDKGGVPQVTVMTVEETADLDGFQPGTTFSPSDQVAVIVDDKGIAIGMGIVPAMVSVRQSAHIAVEAHAASVAAIESVAAVEAFETEFVSGMNKVQGDFNALKDNLGSIQADVTAIKGSPANHAVLMHRVDVLEAEAAQFKVVGERVAKLEGKALAQVGDLGVKTYTVDVGNTMAEFAQSAVTALKTIDEPRNANLKEYINAVEIKQGELELAIRAGDPEMVAGATVELLDNMRTMIGGAGVDAGAKRKLDAQFRAMKGLLG